MLAAYITAPKEMELRDDPLLTVAPGQVLLRVLYNAVCGSELPAYLGISTGYPHYKRIVRYPFGPFGHEGVARVEETGAGVEAFQRGDLVLGGGYYEYCALPTESLLKVPEGVEAKLAAMTMTALETLWAVEWMRASPDDEALVLGAGPFGLTIIEHLREKGCKVIVCAEVLKDRLDVAKELGATGTIDVSREPLDEGVNRFFENGPSLSIDTSAKAEPIRALIKLTRRFGRVGLYGRPVEVMERFEVEDIFHRQIEVHGLKCRDYSPQIKMRALEMIRKGELHARRLITHVFPLSRINEAFELAAVRKEGLKVLVQCGEDV